MMTLQKSHLRALSVKLLQFLQIEKKIRLAKLLKSLMTPKTKSLPWPHFTLRKKKFQPRGKFTAGQSRSPIAMPTGDKYRSPRSAWQAMSEEERQDALKVMLAFNENRD